MDKNDLERAKEIVCELEDIIDEDFKTEVRHVKLLTSELYRILSLLSSEEG